MLFGYAVTAIVFVSFIALVASIVFGRKEIWKALKPNVNKYSIIALILILLFFLLFAILFVSPAEQLYFDENIYQGIALNILHNGNAAWCQYGTAYDILCPYSVVYHDPVGWSFFIAIAFALFGVGKGTAYGLQLFVGLLSIIGVFLLSAVLFRRKDVPVLAAAFMALNPELFVWSRTQATADLPFMMLTIFTFFFFVVYQRRGGIYALVMTASSLVIVSYTRIEAFLLVPFLAILYFAFGEKGAIVNARNKVRSLIRSSDGLVYFAVLLLLVIFLVPEFFYLVSQNQSGNYGQPTGGALLSIANLKTNFYPNLQFLLGELNYIYNYPVVFPFEITLAAVLGAAIFIFEKKQKDRFPILLLLGLWFVGYYVFYDFFYAGSALYGVDVRFMLQILPPLAILAGLGIAELASLAVKRISRVLVKKYVAKVGYAFAGILLIILALYPFVSLISNTTLEPSQMPQQGKVLPAVNFIYNNYEQVPQNCLVFSFTPDLWYTLNRSSAQIGYLGSANYTFTGFADRFSCFVLDYGYWCQVPPYQNTTCSDALSNYKLKPIVVENNSTAGTTLGLYYILNYTK